MGFNPKGLHCSFIFHQFIELGTFQPDIAKSLDVLIEEHKAFYEQLEAKLPSAKEIREAFPWQEWQYCQAFSGLKEDIAYNGDKHQVTIDHKSMPYAPSLLLESASGFLNVQLHNCAVPQLAIIMYKHGLHALQKVYQAYGFDESFLPTLTFDISGASLSVPFPVVCTHLRIVDAILAYAKGVPHHKIVIREDAQYHAQAVVEGIPLERKADGKQGTFTAFIPRTKKKRNEIATDLLHIAVLQSQGLYYANDHQEEEQ